jgi:CRISPR-associated protein Cmr5
MKPTGDISSQTLDQRRAGHAWTAIGKVKTWTSDQHKKDYAGMAKKMPVRIMAAGLGPALAFVLAKAGDGRDKQHIKQLHDDLTDWVIQGRKIKATVPKSLLESVIKGTSDFLRQATDEALVYMQWLNRFAEAEGLSSQED